MARETYEPVIGLEVHAQLRTRTKAFCGCSTRFGDQPNTNVCPVCLGMPGTLPVANRTMVEFILRLGMALECEISPRSSFARKNYFYPDLPKGYQISQFEEPMCRGGHLELELAEGQRRRIGITRIHMEEDAGKLIHDQGADTLVDVNRCGVPLIEIVSEPDLRSPQEAAQFLSSMRQIVTYLEICDGNMEEGSLRCDANVSVRRRGETRYGTKTELKNMNSFRNVERALEFEIHRQIGLLEDGRPVVQETLLWDSARSVATPMRGKEAAHDYRYFPEPDLVPVLVDDAWMARVRAELPELPGARRARLVEQLSLPPYDAGVLTAERETAEYFEQTLHALSEISARPQHENAKVASNWVMTEILGVAVNRAGPGAAFPVPPANLARLINLVQRGTISGSTAKTVFEAMISSQEEPEAIVRARGLMQVSDEDAIETAVSAVLEANAPQVQKYLEGSEKVFGFFVGETMRRMKGKGNPRVINELLRKALDRRRSAGV
jgi:aspartyl-tRNA(Asn)/glutamyl-tRNA(Gln) amidotransferase subunit B